MQAIDPSHNPSSSHCLMIACVAETLWKAIGTSSISVAGPFSPLTFLLSSDVLQQLSQVAPAHKHLPSLMVLFIHFGLNWVSSSLVGEYNWHLWDTWIVLLCITITKNLLHLLILQCCFDIRELWKGSSVLFSSRIVIQITAQYKDWIQISLPVWSHKLWYTPDGVASVNEGKGSV